MKRKINFAIKSSKGKRKVNQDSLACSFNDNKDFCAIVCDGVGSVQGSEFASKLVTDVFTESFSETYTMSSPTVWFKDTLSRVLKRLKTLSDKKRLPGIATTLALLIVANGKYYSYNIGDTRVYKINGTKLTLCSHDHSYKNYLISRGIKGKALDAYRAKWHSITSFVDATHPKLARFECNSGSIEPNTKFVICTDGVYAYIQADKAIEIINKKYRPLYLKSSLLNKEALKQGSRDNVSNIIINVK